MKVADFNERLRNVPRYGAYFRLTSKPNWIDRWDTSIQVGDLFIAIDNLNTMRHVKTGADYGIGPSYLKFDNYYRLNP